MVLREMFVVLHLKKKPLACLVPKTNLCTTRARHGVGRNANDITMVAIAVCIMRTQLAELPLGSGTCESLCSWEVGLSHRGRANIRPCKLQNRTT